MSTGVGHVRAELGSRHTGGHDAALTLELLLALMYWWREGKCTKLFENKDSKRALRNGAEALQLHHDSFIKQFEARYHAERAARSFKNRLYSKMTRKQEQRRDPTTRYKSELSVNSLELLRKWTVDDS
jgi:hypothetical protein